MADPLPVLNNAIAVRDTLARLIADVYAGNLQPRVAAGLAPLLNLQLRTIETVTKLEAEAQAKRAKREVDDERPATDLTDAELEQGLHRLHDLSVQEEATKPFSSADSLELSKSLLQIA